MSAVDVLHARVVFRDRPLVDVLDLALRFVVLQWRAYAKIALLALAPSLAATLAIAHYWGWLFAWLAAIALGLLAEVPITALVSRLVFDDHVNVKDVAFASLRALPRIATMRVLWALSIAASAAIFFFPAVAVWTSLLFASEVLLLERAGIARSLVRSYQISTSSFGTTLAGALLLALFAMCAVLLTEVGGRIVIEDLLQFHAPPFARGGSVLSAVGWFCVIPYITTARFFLYLNVRTRAEGWDIQARFAAIAARAGNASP
ncbi:MAG: hypothetical protein FWD73_17575 [Polyangiaceae bacterium]|nr:hypothetical protein [Polyangiaceae bacterium]